jgi:hypothetical protein
VSSNPGKNGARYTLTSASNVTSPSGPVVQVYVGFEDYSAIKLLPGLAITRETTWISFPR